jgi:hypothetical protein
MKNLILLVFIFLSIPLIVNCQTDSINLKSSDETISRSRLYNITEMNFGFGLGDTNADYSKSLIGLTSSIDFGIVRNLLGGIGTGISFYNGGTLIPIYLDLRYFLNLGKISIYGSGDGGLLLNLSEIESDPKIFINPSVGFVYPLRENLKANMSVGLFSQTNSNNSHDSFINFKLGMTYMFKSKKN